VPASYPPPIYPKDLAKVDSNTRITVVPEHWLFGGVSGTERTHGQMRFFEGCYGANESEWVAATSYEGDEVEYRLYDRDRDTFTEWRRAFFLSSYMYDGIVVRVLWGATPTSVYPVFGDELRKPDGSGRTVAETGDTLPPSSSQSITT
jgi:hypothetical protein